MKTRRSNAMSRISALSLVILAASSFGLAQSAGQSAPKSKAGAVRPKLRIAVNQGRWEALKYENYTVNYDVRRALQAKIIEKLQRSGMFEVLERQDEAEGQRRGEEARAMERDIRQASQGRTPMPLREAAIPADYIITPEIVGFNVTSRKSNSINVGRLLNKIIPGGQSSTDKVKAVAELNLRISSAETTSVLDIASGKGEHEQSNSRIDGAIFGIGISQEQFRESPVGKAVEEAIEEAVNAMVARLATMPWKGLVVAVSQTTGRITINRGATSGIQTGMIFTVMDADPDGIDHETGIPIPGDETPIGKIRIVRVEGKYAYAEVVSGSGFKPKNVVRFLD